LKRAENKTLRTYVRAPNDRKIERAASSTASETENDDGCDGRRTSTDSDEGGSVSKREHSF